MGPVELCLALYQLSFDSNALVHEAARKTASELPDRILDSALSQATHAHVLDWFSALIRARSTPIEQIVLNPVTDPETIAEIAKSASEHVCEVIAVNQERLLRFPAIIEALYLNRNVRMSTVDRLVELAARRGVALKSIPAFEQAKAAISKNKEAPAPADPQTDAVFREALTYGDDLVLADKAGDADNFEARLAITPKAEEKQKRIQDLSVNAKVRLASIGNMFHRMTLIRESNRIVAMAVIQSPAVTEAEVVRYAALRNVADEIIRYVATRKEWIRLYGVKKALANNPKCPLSVSLHLLPHLRPSDLRSLVVSRDVPSAVTTAAKKMIRGRGA